MFSYGQTEFYGVCFGISFDRFWYEEGDSVDILMNMTINEYGGKEKLQFSVKDVRAAGFREDRYFAGISAYEDYRCGKVDPRLICRMKPGTDEMKKAYDILRKTKSLEKAEYLASLAGINVCMFRIILDVFEEFDLARTDIADGTVKLLPAKKKADLGKSKILARLSAYSKK